MSHESKRKLLAIIDGKSVFYRGYYAMPNLSTKDGMPTGGVYGFTSLSVELIRRLKPDYVIVAWDKAKTNIRKRKQIYPEYKAGRKPAPADFYEQIPILHELLDGFGWPLYELDDYEADDILGTMAKQANEQDVEVALITSDLDALQAVGPLTHVYAMKKGLSNIEKFDISAFEDKYGIEVDQFLDFKSLTGDSSDNLPGVPGVGSKTATNLLQQFGSLDAIYDNLEQIKPALRSKLEAGRELAYTTRRVAEMWFDAPIELDLQAADVSKYDWHKLKELLQQLEFRGLLNRLQQEFEKVDDLDDKVVIPTFTTVNTNLTDKALPKHINILSTDVSYLVWNEDVITVSDGHNLVNIDIGQTIDNKFLHVLQEYFDSSSLIVAYGVKDIMHRLVKIGISLKSTVYDVRLVAYILNALIRDKSLAALAGGSVDESDPAQVVAVLMELREYQVRELDDLPRLKEIVFDIELPMTRLLFDMERAGVKLDVAKLAELESKLKSEVAAIEKRIYELAGLEFNINSPLQLSGVLFDTLNLPTAGIKKSKTAYSTGAKELRKLKDFHPIVNEISHFRELSKLLTTYIVALPKLVDENSYIHTTFAQDVVPTGRLSSSNPNLQNIPIRSKQGLVIREAFVAADGNTLISADYSQFELRLAAAITGDSAMVKAFDDGVDIHLQTAAQLHDISFDEVTKKQRSAAKAVNFGIMYGLGPHALSESTDMTFSEARQFITKYFEIRPKLKLYLDNIRVQATELGYVETILGRRRPTPDIRSSNYMVREAAYRAAINMPIQGSAADIMKLAMLKIDDSLPKGSKQIMQIHDSVIVECTEAQSSEVAKILTETMENIYPSLAVQLKVDIAISKTWAGL